MNKHPHRPLVLGLGNEILSDDGFGIAVANEIKSFAFECNVDVETTSLGGFHLLDYFEGREKILIIDAAKIPSLKAGEIRLYADKDFHASDSIYSQHQVDLPTVLAFGRQIKMKMPDSIDLLLCGAEDVTMLNEEMTPCVHQAIPEAVETVREWINKVVQQLQTVRHRVCMS